MDAVSIPVIGIIIVQQYLSLFCHCDKAGERSAVIVAVFSLYAVSVLEPAESAGRVIAVGGQDVSLSF